MRNKIANITLILILLILPFNIFLDVKAEDLTIITDSNNKIENTTTVTVNISTHDEQERQVGDTFNAFKVLDSYYNKNSNEVNYRFTTNFQNFLNSLDSNDTYKSLTIDDYMNLTGDNYKTCREYGDNNTCLDWAEENYSMNLTTSTLNILISKYATYIKSNNISQDYQLITNSAAKTAAATVEVGAYLILPVNVEPMYSNQLDDYNFRIIGANNYGVMIANTTLEIVDNKWALEPKTINAKSEENGIVYFKGLNNGTYYLKQVKAPTGYRLYDKTIKLQPTTEGSNSNPVPSGTGNALKKVKIKKLAGNDPEIVITLGEDGYYNLTGEAAIKNSLVLALPFTGGIGTIIYTILGLTIITGSIMFIVL